MTLRPLHIAGILFTCMLLLFYACKPSQDNTSIGWWTSTDPLAFPHKVRYQKYLRGNEVFNPSFEAGRFFSFDSLNKSAKIDGWEVIGNHVEYLDFTQDSLIEHSNEVYHGKKAIKISRAVADETETMGVGVMSDYIRVIPGNYLLSLYLNLKDIYNPKSRLGTSIFDAVDIRILYYDKNRIPIDGKHCVRQLPYCVNSSFKGASFSNMTSIDSTGWLKVIGRSHDYPYPDGDLPDETRYIRIFIGLKGRGTMWIDQVSFEYTRWNLTLLERTKPFFDSLYPKYQMLVPKPQQVSGMESLIFYRPYNEDQKFPLILIPENADLNLQFAAELLQKRIISKIEAITGEKLEAWPAMIVHQVQDQELDNGRLIFSIGKNYLSMDSKIPLPYDKIAEFDQGYFVHTNSDFNNIIFLDGNTTVDALRATYTVLQLFDSKKYIFHNANIIDFPAYKKRCFMPGDKISSEFMEDLFQAKLNGLYTQSSLTGKSKNLVEQYGPLQYRLIQSSDQLSSLNGYDGYVYTTSNFSTDNAFGESWQTEQSVIIKRLQAIGKPVEFVPSVPGLQLINASAIKAQFYFKDLNNYCPGLNYLFNGLSTCSWRLDDVDFYRFAALTGKPVTFLDNTLYLRSQQQNFFGFDTLCPEKLPSASRFDPYSNDVVANIGGWNEWNKIIAEYPVESETDLIRLLTAADYYWNPDQYNSDLSLYKILINRFGTEQAQILLELDNIYFGLKSEMLKYNQSGGLQKHIRKSRVFISSYVDILNALSDGKQSTLAKDYIRLINVLIDEFSLIDSSFNQDKLDSLLSRNY